MSGTADTNGAIATPDGLFLDAGDPVGALYTRTVFSNLNHYADAIAPACVNWTSGPASVSARVVEPDGTLAAGVWYRLGVWGPFPVLFRADGTPYRFRIRLHGGSTGGAFTIFRVVISTPDDRDIDRDLAEDFAWQGSTTSSSAVEVPGVTQGDDASAFLARLDAVEGSRLVREEGTVRDFGGDTSSVLTAWAAAKVYTQTTSPASTPQLAALHISQAVG
jgi:hypothetical protein